MRHLWSDEACGLVQRFVRTTVAPSVVRSARHPPCSSSALSLALAQRPQTFQAPMHTSRSCLHSTSARMHARTRATAEGAPLPSVGMAADEGAASTSGSAPTVAATRHHRDLTLLFGHGPLWLRRTLEAMTAGAMHTFKVAGVTFDDRQETVRLTQAGHAVMLVRQPWNVHDPGRAVEVLTLAGHPLGYVPKAINADFQHHELVFGHVDYVGCAPDTTTWGMRVTAQPNLMPASVSPFPAQLLPAPQTAAAPPPPPPTPAAAPAAGAGAPQAGRAYARRGRPRKVAEVAPTDAGQVGAGGTAAAQGGAQGEVHAASAAAQGGVQGAAAANGEDGVQARLRAALGEQSWQRLCDDARARSRGVCEVTGASEEVTALEFVTVWQYDTQRRVAKLLRLALVSRDVALAHRALDLAPGSPELADASWALLLINGWHRGGPLVQAEGHEPGVHGELDAAPELQQHLDAMQGLRKRLLEEGWTVDLSLSG